MRRHQELTPLPVSILIFAIVLFVVAALLAMRSTTVPGDELVLDRIQALPSTPVRPILGVANVIGDTIAGPIAVVVLAIVCAWRRFAAGIAFCLTLLVLRLGGMYLKRVFDSPRPEATQADIRGHFDGLGFPSGHAMTAVCIAFGATVIIRAVADASILSRIVIGILWTLAALCGVARIWYGAHWPTDVVGGAAAAIAMVWIASWIGVRYQRATTNQATPATSATVDPQRRSVSR